MSGMITKMNSPLTTANDTAAIEYLAAARQHHSQTTIANHLGVSERQVRRWEVGESHPPQYDEIGIRRKPRWIELGAWE
jgi:DNA (cytosine-5)-methyltransferase 1